MVLSGWHRVLYELLADENADFAGCFLFRRADGGDNFVVAKLTEKFTSFHDNLPTTSGSSNPKTATASRTVLGTV